MILISKDAPTGFVGGPAQWIKEAVFIRMRSLISSDVKKEYDKIALVGECEDRLTLGKEHELIKIYALVDHDSDNYKLIELKETHTHYIGPSRLITLETEETGEISVHMDVSRFNKRICFESDSKLLLYFVLGVKK